MAQGEFEEARAIMRRMNAENKLMHTILVQGRSLFGKLQESMPAEESNTPEVSLSFPHHLPCMCISLNRRGPCSLGMTISLWWRCALMTLT